MGNRVVGTGGKASRCGAGLRSPGQHRQWYRSGAVLDMWEHAYYLQYLTEKKDWVAAFWKMVNWEDVAGAMSVRSLDLLL